MRSAINVEEFRIMHGMTKEEAPERDGLTVNDYPHFNAAKLAAGLKTLYDVQTYVSGMIPGCVPDEDEEPSRDAVATYFLALQVEVAELLQELNWKPWKDGKDPDVGRVADELADVLAFLGVVLIYVQRTTGLSMEDLAWAYGRKTQVNLQRAAGKVDGYRTNGQR